MAKTERMWALVTARDGVLAVRGRRQSCVRYAIDINAGKRWETIKRKFGLRVVRCTVTLEVEQ